MPIAAWSCHIIIGRAPRGVEAASISYYYIRIADIIVDLNGGNEILRTFFFWPPDLTDTAVAATATLTNSLANDPKIYTILHDIL